MISAGLLSELDSPGSKGIGKDPQAPDYFIIRHEEGVTAFHNQCPHTGAPLNWQPDQFFDMDNEFILCSLHGALFRPRDGLCLRGPCVNQSLKPIPVSIDEGEIWLHLAD